MKLSKTQKALILETERYKRNTISAEWHHGQGAYGGHVSGGKREFLAVSDLEKRGLVKRTNYYSTRHYQRGYCVHIGVLTVEMVDRDALVAAAKEST